MPCVFEQLLQFIGNKITVSDKDRQVYINDYNIIRDYMINIMKRHAAFKAMFRGTSLFGSYANNVRIDYPDEFDVIVVLEIPFSSYIDVKQDEDCPGFVNLDLEDVMEQLENHTGNKAVKELLEDDLVDWNNSLLRRSNVKFWFASMIEDGLSEVGNQVKGDLGDWYKLEYSTRGLAHTVFAHCEVRKISIDFIPGFKFGPAEWVSTRTGYPFTSKDFYTWYAVPKPTFGPRYSKMYRFMMCNPEVEHRLLLNKQNLKVVFRLLKSLRNKYSMPRMKSYFFTTAFLWEVESLEDAFWEGELHHILVHMLQKLYAYFHNKRLPFFWDSDYDLLDIFSDTEKNDYALKLFKAYRKLRTYHGQSKLMLKTCLRHFSV